MSTSYYRANGDLVGVYQWTKPGPTFVWAVNPATLMNVIFIQPYHPIKDEYGTTFTFPEFKERLEHCTIQTWNSEEIPA